MFQVNQQRGQRFSAADAYLRPALARPNLEVRKHVSALGVAFEGERAVGVRVRSRRARGARARPARGAAERRRDRLAAAPAAVGIGPPRSSSGSASRSATSCRVGRNLQDHPFVTLIWEVSDQQTLYGAERPRALAEWLLRRSGKLSSTVAEVVAFVRTAAACPPPTSSSTWAPPTSKTTAPRNTTGTAW